MAEEKLAVILIRSRVGVRKDVVKTLDLLRLKSKNVCTIIPDNQVNRGMLQFAKDFVTYGAIDAETEKLLVEKRGQPDKSSDKKDAIKPFFRLHPPRKGYGKKGVKVPFNNGGALGDRKTEINDLIKRMI